MKSGTSAAVLNLKRHPDLWIVDRDIKQYLADERDYPEVHFFSDDSRWCRGIEWYSRYFEAGRGHSRIGEKTPAYLSNTTSHARMAQIVPNARLIVLLREPVQRCYSHWNHFREMFELPADIYKIGQMTFDDAVSSSIYSEDKHRDLVSMGYYALQLEHLFKYFPKEQIHIAIAERVRDNMMDEYNRMFHFLGLPLQFDELYQHYHQRQKPELQDDGKDVAAQEFLKNHYAEHNQRLYTLLGEEIPEWTSA